MPLRRLGVLEHDVLRVGQQLRAVEHALRGPASRRARPTHVTQPRPRLDAETSEPEAKTARRETVEEEVDREVDVVHDLKELLPEDEGAAGDVALVHHVHDESIAAHCVRR